MSLKGVLKKKLKIKNPIMKMKKKKQKQKLVSDTPADTYTKIFDADNLKNEHSEPDNVQTNVTASDTPLKSGDYQDTNTNTNDIKESKKKIGKKRKSSDNDTSNKCETPQKKKVTFAADVKSENDQKCTAGIMKPISLNKKKKLNYIKKLKAKKKKQKNIKKCEEEAAALRIPRQERAIEYLMQWKNDRSNWKFKKIYQLWLIKNTYDLTKASILCS